MKLEKHLPGSSAESEKKIRLQESALIDRASNLVLARPEEIQARIDELEKELVKGEGEIKITAPISGLTDKLLDKAEEQEDLKKYLTSVNHQIDTNFSKRGPDNFELILGQEDKIMEVMNQESVSDLSLVRKVRNIIHAKNVAEGRNYFDDETEIRNTILSLAKSADKKAKEEDAREATPAQTNTWVSTSTANVSEKTNRAINEKNSNNKEQIDSDNIENDATTEEEPIEIKKDVVVDSAEEAVEAVTEDAKTEDIPETIEDGPATTEEGPIETQENVVEETEDAIEDIETTEDVSKPEKVKKTKETMEVDGNVITWTFEDEDDEEAAIVKTREDLVSVIKKEEEESSEKKRLSLMQWFRKHKKVSNVIMAVVFTGIGFGIGAAVFNRDKSEKAIDEQINKDGVEQVSEDDSHDLNDGETIITTPDDYDQDNIINDNQIDNLKDGLASGHDIPDNILEKINDDVAETILEEVGYINKAVVLGPEKGPADNRWDAVGKIMDYQMNDFHEVNFIDGETGAIYKNIPAGSAEVHFDDLVLEGENGEYYVVCFQGFQEKALADAGDQLTVEEPSVESEDVAPADGAGDQAVESLETTVDTETDKVTIHGHEKTVTVDEDGSTRTVETTSATIENSVNLHNLSSSTFNKLIDTVNKIKAELKGGETVDMLKYRTDFVNDFVKDCEDLGLEVSDSQKARISSHFDSVNNNTDTGNQNINKRGIQSLVNQIAIENKAN
ncbi:MAG: hypothetical protein ACOX0C_00465 [Patescibacteria group bacterium]|jgi:hypothetical protein